MALCSYPEHTRSGKQPSARIGVCTAHPGHTLGWAVFFVRWWIGAIEEEVENMKKTRNPIMRPVAWVATWVMLLLIEQVARLVCGLGGWLVGLASGWSTIVVIIVAIIFGGTYLSLYFYSSVMVATITVTASNFLYPTKKGARYIAFGVYELIGNVAFILLCAIGPKLGIVVTGGPLFWLYARYVWLIIFSICLISCGKSSASDQK